MPNNENDDILEAKKRLESLPENLKKEILADKNVQLINNICRDYSIPEDKIKHIALLAGEVFLGYIKPEEIAHELNTYFDIDLQKSNFIEIELKQKLFNGLKADLDKIYSPLKTEAQPEEEASPTIIKLETDQQPATNGQQQRISPLTIGNIPAQPAKTETPAMPKAEPAMSEAPFIIQTKIEAVKAAVPQFPKETPSLNLKVDPSIIQKNPAVKPISIHLETAQPATQEKRFQMPVIAGQKIFSSAAPTEKPAEKPAIKPAAAPIPQPEPALNLQGKPIAIEVKTPASQPMPQPSQNLGGLMGQAKEPVKTVHYSNFKTDLTHLGTPVKPEPRKEDFINLNTFTKISGNTVDLRGKTDK